mmetsp:Transcript_111252/g.314912  ORF Transcript_111252/g.314912 Transcript_111252/m.314912 type:complete len:211 (-) Transcript_111252:2172-2804(-)
MVPLLEASMASAMSTSISCEMARPSTVSSRTPGTFSMPRTNSGICTSPSPEASSALKSRHIFATPSEDAATGAAPAPGRLVSRFPANREGLASDFCGAEVKLSSLSTATDFRAATVFRACRPRKLFWIFSAASSISDRSCSAGVCMIRRPILFSAACIQGSSSGVLPSLAVLYISVKRPRKSSTFMRIAPPPWPCPPPPSGGEEGQLFRQ